MAAVQPTFFATASEFRRWLRKHSATASELVVGFRRVGAGRPSLTWPEAVDEALCVGWVDGVRHRIDDTSYKIRFSPRKAGSIWSAVNIERVRDLSEAGRMQPAGLEAFNQRSEIKSRVYSYEQQVEPKLAPAQESAFRRSKRAWAFFELQPPSYRKKVLRWVVTARQEATRARRLAALIEASDNGHRL